MLTQPKQPVNQHFEQQSLIKEMRNTHLFRSLNGKEEEAVSVVDNRDITMGKPNNRVLITCDHASNDIKYTRPHEYEEELIRSQEYFDIGTADMV